ncbi:MAG: hypothetical protein IJA02_01045 [Clostridia bacterium]|nr:hypothetical protein [Clostridia bacterium]
MSAKTLPVLVLCLSWHFSQTRQLFERKEPVLLTVIQVINRNNQLVGRINGFRIYGIRFGVMVCIDLNGWLVQNKLSLPDEAPEQFNTNFLVGVLIK